MNLLSPKLNKIDQTIKKLKAMGDNTVYLYLFNQSDGEGSGYSAYDGDKMGGSLNEAKIKAYREKIEKFKEAKLDIIFWLRADEWIRKYPEAEQIKYQADMVTQFNDDAAAWVIGFKMNQHMLVSSSDKYVKHLKEITSKPVGIHCGYWDYDWALSSGADVFYADYGFLSSPDKMSEATKSTIRNLGGKAKFIAATYNRTNDSKEAIELGKAAMAAGADGTGNGR